MNTVPAVMWGPAFGQSEAAADLHAALTELYTSHYQPLVRLASMLVRDTGTAEEIVQDAFVALYGSWSGLRDTGKARAYLHRSVANGARSVLRRRAVASKHARTLASPVAGADHPALALVERSAVMLALRELPARQREALVLRFYGDLPEADIARAMGISPGAVKSHTSRAMSALRRLLDDATSLRLCRFGQARRLADDQPSETATPAPALVRSLRSLSHQNSRANGRARPPMPNPRNAARPWM